MNAEDRIVAAVDLIADLGPVDGAHHKDYVLQQAVRILMDWNEEQLNDWLEDVQWSKGIAP